MTVTATLMSLSAKSLGEIEVPVPSARELDAVARLVEASEEVYAESVEAARLRRETLRDLLLYAVEGIADGHGAVAPRLGDLGVRPAAGE